MPMEHNRGQAEHRQQKEDFARARWVTINSFSGHIQCPARMAEDLCWKAFVIYLEIHCGCGLTVFWSCSLIDVGHFILPKQQSKEDSEAGDQYQWATQSLQECYLYIKNFCTRAVFMRLRESYLWLSISKSLTEKLLCFWHK